MQPTTKSNAARQPNALHRMVLHDVTTISRQENGKIRACHFPCLEALEVYNLANLARCAEQFHKCFHGNIFYQIPPKNRI